MKVNNFLGLFIILFLFCSKEKMDKESLELSINNSSINIKAIENLASKKIFFGHMSVGYNILQGLEKIIEEDDRFHNIKILELISDEDAISEPGIYHTKNGKNGLPKTKCDAFLNFLREKNRGDKIDIAFFKFCYVDVERDYDIKKLFNYYNDTIDHVKNEFPNLRIIHVTLPLTTHGWGLKGFIKNLIIGDLENVKRNRFNELIINRYRDSDVDTIFDLAKIESTLPDGLRCTFHYKGNNYFSLYPSYTHDGGHLNKHGRFYAAKELLNILLETSINSHAN